MLQSALAHEQRALWQRLARGFAGWLRCARVAAAMGVAERHTRHRSLSSSWHAWRCSVVEQAWFTGQEALGLGTIALIRLRRGVACWCAQRESALSAAICAVEACTHALAGTAHS